MPEAGIGIKPQTWDKGRWRAEGQLGRNIAADYESPWFLLDGAHPATVCVCGVFTGTVTFYVTDEEDPPPYATDTPTVGTPIEDKADSRMIDGPYRRLRFSVTLSGGSIRSVDFFSRDRGAQN